MKYKRIFLFSTFGIGAAIAAFRSSQLLRPIAPSMGNPAQTYSQAMERIEAIRQGEDSQVRLGRGKEVLNADCMTGVYIHGEKVDHAIVLIHGFTNSPAQYSALAECCLAQGYNVIVPRLPKHGYANRMTAALSSMSAEELVQTCEEAVDIAHGLGKHVTVVGFSLGGVIASWLAQFRADIDRVVIISAAFTVQALPTWLHGTAARLLPLLPDSFRWWDAESKDRYQGARYAYPRFSMHSFAQMLRLSVLVRGAAEVAAPAAREILVSVNLTDQTVNNAGTHQLVEHWRSRGKEVAVHQFDESWALFHDFMDPTQPYARTDEVYPVVMGLVSGIQEGPDAAHQQPGARHLPLHFQ